MPLTSRIDASLCPEGASTAARPHGAFQVLAQIGRAFAREVRVRRGLREIGSLDEAMLRDIGIGPGQLEDVVRHGRGRESARMTDGFDPKPSRDRVFASTDWHHRLFR
jgi:uncharacterized protein YjiS (DUF1127 family)